MRISVVVPAYNEEKLIPATLGGIQSALVSFSRRGWESEIVVCDNNSTDGTAEISRAAGAKVVFEPVNQIGRARNTGAVAATGDWLIFVDADSRPSAELFDDVAMEIEGGKTIAGGSTVRLDEHFFLASCVTALWYWTSRVFIVAAGSFIFCEKAAFNEVGGFDHTLYAAEEIDLSKKLKRLARQRGKRMIILHRHPLITSARKLHLYSKLEWLGFVRKVVLRPRATVTSRDACSPWYDGRR